MSLAEKSGFRMGVEEGNGLSRGRGMYGIKRLLLLVAGMLAVWSGAALAETMDRIVAEVNGDIILYSEVQDRLKLMKKSEPGQNAFAAAEPTEREALQSLIQDRLSHQEVKRLKITVGDREVDEAVANIKRENNLTDVQFEYAIQQEGFTAKQFRENIRKEIERSRLLDRVLKSKTIITDEQVNAAMKTAAVDQTSTTAGKERRRLAIIFLPFPEGAKGTEETEKLARDLYGRLKSGDEFAKVAKQYSKGPAADEGGDIGFMESDELSPAIATAVISLKANGISDPVRASSGIYILKVLDIQREKAVTNAVSSGGDPQVREKVRRQLFQSELGRKFEEWIKDLESRSYIRISL